MNSRSVRNELGLVGQSASLKQLAHDKEQVFPLSLRSWTNALPPGRVVTKAIPLELLQRKFDEFFNNRERPLFKIKVNGTEFGKSETTVFFDEPELGYQPLGDPRDMGHLEFELDWQPDHEYYFNNIESNGLTVNVIAGDPVALQVQLNFETENEEIKVHHFPDINFTEFYIPLVLEFGRSDDGDIDVLKWVENDNLDLTQYINTHVVVTVPWLDDDYVRSKVRKNINEAIFEHLKDEARPFLKRMITPWLAGGEFFVTDVRTDGQSLFIDYVLPLRQLEPFPEVPQQPLDRGPLSNIDHIVVLMMENRSFDHMLGYLSKHAGRGDIDGLHGGETNRYNGVDNFSFPFNETVFRESPCHRHGCVDNQINGGKMDGFVSEFAGPARNQGLNPGDVMGYHKAEHVPVYDALAREFLVCQCWFAAHPGPTFPNRFYTLTGRLNRDIDGNWEWDNPHMGNYMPVTTKTIFDHLSFFGVTWRYYEQGYCFLRLFEKYTTDNSHIVDVRDQQQGFFAAAAAGSLPAVSFIDPDFIDLPPGNDDQPPSDIANGQNLIGRVVQAVMNGPAWDKTLLVITYDEHGGFFDHVPPPSAPPVSSIDRYGVRVPAFIVSPWVQRGGTSTIIFDHTSILKTIIRRFLNVSPPDLGERVAKAHDLSEVVQSTKRSDKPIIPVPPAPPTNVFLTSNSTGDSPTDDRDFNALLRSMRARYPRN